MKRRRFVPGVSALESRAMLDGDLAYQFPLYLPDGPPPPDPSPDPTPDFYNPPYYYTPDGDPLAVQPNDFIATYPADLQEVPQQ